MVSELQGNIFCAVLQNFMKIMKGKLTAYAGQIIEDSRRLENSILTTWHRFPVYDCSDGATGSILLLSPSPCVYIIKKELGRRSWQFTGEVSAAGSVRGWHWCNGQSSLRESQQELPSKSSTQIFSERCCLCMNAARKHRKGFDWIVQQRNGWESTLPNSMARSQTHPLSWTKSKVFFVSFFQYMGSKAKKRLPWTKICVYVVALCLAR